MFALNSNYSFLSSQFECRKTWKHLKITKATNIRNHGCCLTANYARNVADVWRNVKRDAPTTTSSELNFIYLMRFFPIHFLNEFVKTNSRLFCFRTGLARNVLGIASSAAGQILLPIFFRFVTFLLKTQIIKLTNYSELFSDMQERTRRDIPRRYWKNYCNLHKEGLQATMHRSY